MSSRKKILTGENLQDLSNEDLFELLFQSFGNGIRSAKSDFPRAYLKQKGLDWLKLNIGFNSGQNFHRASREYIEAYLQTGFIQQSKGQKGNDKTGFSQFGMYSIIFPLRNKLKQIVNFYGIRIDTKTEQRAFFNNQGVYPGYPSKRTRTLFLTYSVMDCATLLQADVLDNREAVVALFDGETKPQHIQLIQSLPDLEKIHVIN